MEIELTLFPVEYLDIFKSQLDKFNLRVIKDVPYDTMYHNIVVEASDYCDLFLLGMCWAMIYYFNLWV